MVYYCHETIKPYVQVALNHEFGVKRRSLTVNHGSSVRSEGKSDIVSLNVPLAEGTVIWDFIFDLENLLSSPDIIDQDGFFENVCGQLVKDNVPSLINWDARQPDCFLKLILECIQLYQFAKLSILKTHGSVNRYIFEYETLRSIIPTTDIEVTVTEKQRVFTIEFYIVLQLDIDGLPVPPIGDGQTHNILKITYSTQGDTKVELIQWLHLQGLIGDIPLPRLFPEVALLDYVPEVTQYLQSEIQKVKEDLFYRETVMAILYSHLEPSVLDADSINYSSMSFKLKKGGRVVLCTLKLIGKIPKLTLFKTWEFREKPEMYQFEVRTDPESMAHEILAKLLRLEEH